MAGNMTGSSGTTTSEGSASTTAALSQPSIVSADEVRKREEERRKRDQTSQLTAPKEGAGLFMLLALIFGALSDGNEALQDEGLSKSLASIFGIDATAFRQTITDVQSGRVSAFEAATRTYTSIDPAKVDYSRANVPIAELVQRKGPTLLNPDLVKKMESDPTVRRYVQMTFEAADRHHLDGKLLANQLWQESRYNPNAVSGCNAVGIGQFMPFHKGKWGLNTDADFRDPAKSIEASARFMEHLTQKTGSQQLALVAYNGGEKAVEWVEKLTPGKAITIQDWMTFVNQERATKGVGSAGLWRNQTFDYVTKIDSNFWTQAQVNRAQNQGQSQLVSTFAQGGVDQTQKPPVGLTAAHTLTLSTGGKDQTAATTLGLTSPFVSGLAPTVKPVV